MALSPPGGRARGCYQGYPLEVPRAPCAPAGPRPGSPHPAPRLTPPATCVVFLFPLDTSLPPTLRNSSPTCPTGWSTPSAYGPIWPQTPPSTLPSPHFS